MVIVQLTAGLGNQLFQYAAARSLALELGQKLIIDNSIYLKDNYRKPRLNFFNHHSYVTIHANRYTSTCFKKLLFPLLPETKNIIEAEWFRMFPFPTEDLSKVKVIKLIGGWGSLRYFERYEKIIKNELYVKPRYTKRISALMSDIRLTNSVAIHIRKGDYIQSIEAKEIFYELTADYYQRAIEYIASKIVNPIFYIFTNDMNWVNKNFMTRPEYKYIYVSKDHNLKDYEEFELMRNCKNQVIANSTFSWWAAYLNPNKNKIIIQPQVWYHHEAAQSSYENGEVLGKLGLLI